MKKHQINLSNNSDAYECIRVALQWLKRNNHLYKQFLARFETMFRYLRPGIVNPELLGLNQDTILENEALGMAFPVDSTYVTGPGKTGLIYTKYTCSYNSTYLLFCICYPKSVNIIECLMDLCIHDDSLDAIRIADKKLLHFKLSKSGQILHVDKTCFPRPGHIF